ncbi:hypothetical protein YC2023_093753 [Brassica napus]
MEEEDVKNMMKWRPAWPKTIVKADHIFELMKQLCLPNHHELIIVSQTTAMVTGNN